MSHEQSSENVDGSAARRTDDIDLSGEEITGDESDDIEDVEEVVENDEDDEQHALEVRRAIEDHLDRSRLQKEIDYMFDEGFAEGGAEEEDKE